MPPYRLFDIHLFDDHLKMDWSIRILRVLKGLSKLGVKMVHHFKTICCLSHICWYQRVAQSNLWVGATKPTIIGCFVKENEY